MECFSHGGSLAFLGEQERVFIFNFSLSLQDVLKKNGIKLPQMMTLMYTVGHKYSQFCYVKLSKVSQWEGLTF